MNKPPEATQVIHMSTSHVTQTEIQTYLRTQVKHLSFRQHEVTQVKITRSIF